MRQNEVYIYKNRKWMDLSDYYISVFLNNANITEVCGLWVVSRMQSPQEGFVFGWWSGKGTQQFSVSDCINLQSVHLQTEHQAFLLWGCTQPVGRMQTWSMGALDAVFVAVPRSQ